MRLGKKEVKDVIEKAMGFIVDWLAPYAERLTIKKSRLDKKRIELDWKKKGLTWDEFQLTDLSQLNSSGPPLSTGHWCAHDIRNLFDITDKDLQTCNLDHLPTLTITPAISAVINVVS